MKCLEMLLLGHIHSVVLENIDRLQFAYPPNKSVDDVVTIALYHTLQHLDCGRAYCMSGCSSFSTALPMQYHSVWEAGWEVGQPGSPSCHLQPCSGFLTDSPQVVRIGGIVASKLTISTGSPQGCCLCPKLFTLYTHECIYNTNDALIIKYVDDTTILGLIKGGDKTDYRRWSIAYWTTEM